MLDVTFDPIVDPGFFFQALAIIDINPAMSFLISASVTTPLFTLVYLLRYLLYNRNTYLTFNIAHKCSSLAERDEMMDTELRIRRYYRCETSLGFEQGSRNRGSNLPHQSQYPLTYWNSEMMTMIVVMVVVLWSTTINCALSTPVFCSKFKVLLQIGEQVYQEPATNCVSQYQLCVSQFTSKSSEVIVRSIFYSWRRLPLVNDQISV